MVISAEKDRQNIGNYVIITTYCKINCKNSAKSSI
jgi:hypothetical protein